MNTKFSYFLIILLFSSTVIFSQKIIGLEGGMNFSSLQFEKKASSSPKLGLGARIGINYLYKINNSFDFELGIFYLQKGQRIKSTGKIALFTTGFANIEEIEKYKLNYLQFPLSLDYNLTSSLFISCGLYLAYGLGGYYLVENTYIDPKTQKVIESSSYREDFIPEKESQWGFNTQRTYNKINYGFNFGIGYRFGRFSMKSEFDLGLSSALKIDDMAMFNTVTKSLKNRSLSISLVYYISKHYYRIRY